LSKNSRRSQRESERSAQSSTAAVVETSPRQQPYEWLILAALSVVLLLQLWTSIRRLSVTYDEVDHLHAGYRYWQCGDFGWNPEHPPLAKMLAALPLQFMTIQDPILGACGMTNSKHLDFEKGSEFLQANSQLVLFAARAVMSVFALALLVVVWFAARAMFGLEVAGIAGTLLVFEPNFLGHGALVTTDVPASLGIFAAVFAFWAYLEKRTTARLLLLGVTTGAALALKHSAMLLAPILLALAIADPFVHRSGSADRQTARNITRNLAALAFVAVIAIALLWTAYGWRYAARPSGAIWKNPFLQYTEGALPNRLVPAAKEARILPEAYLTGLQDVLISSEIGRPFFLRSKIYPGGRWFGFPAAIALKSTLVLLLFSVLGCAAVKLWRERRRELLFLTLPPALYFAASLNSGLGNGIRHLLPILPFCVIFAAAGVASLVGNRRLWQALVALAIVLHAASSLHAFPNYISYGNELAGGPQGIYAYLSDSNVDWGQGLKIANTYIERTHPQPCWIIQVTWIPDSAVPCGETSPSRHEIPPVHFKGTLIVSNWLLAGMATNTGGVRAVEIFRGRKPKATLAGSAMLVYEGEFDLSPIAAEEHYRLAQAAKDNNNDNDNHNDQALTRSELQTAIALDPRFAAPHIQLCVYATFHGDMTGAEQECNRALELSLQDPATPKATTRSLARFMRQHSIRIQAQNAPDN
jgi:hypothetical protein